MIFVDEVDSFSKSLGSNKDFKTFLTELMQIEGKRVCFVGIANSIELFKGELSQDTKLKQIRGSLDVTKTRIRKQFDELKLKKVLFESYTMKDLMSILE